MFKNPQFLFMFLGLIPFLLYEIYYKNKNRVCLPHTRVDIFRKINKRSSLWQFLPILLRVLAMSFLIIALARPVSAKKKSNVTGKGIDILFAIDISESMLAMDFKPTDRLQAAKKVAIKFIENRKKDKIGIITFSDNAFTACPLTLDYNLLVEILQNVKVDEGSKGTAIGLGLATSVARAKESQGKSKVIILLTDGRNNAGDLSPKKAAELAKTFEIKVYPIGIGNKGLVDYPYTDAFGKTVYQKVNIPLDMNSLNEIAKTTGTEFAYRAQNIKELEQIFKRIDALEKTQYKIENYFEYKEKFEIFLALSLLFVILEFLLRTIFKRNLP